MLKAYINTIGPLHLRSIYGEVVVNDILIININIVIITTIIDKYI